MKWHWRFTRNKHSFASFCSVLFNVTLFSLHFISFNTTKYLHFLLCLFIFSQYVLWHRVFSFFVLFLFSSLSLLLLPVNAFKCCAPTKIITKHVTIIHSVENEPKPSPHRRERVLFLFFWLLLFLIFKRKRGVFSICVWYFENCRTTGDYCLLQLLIRLLASVGAMRIQKEEQRRMMKKKKKQKKEKNGRALTKVSHGLKCICAHVDCVVWVKNSCCFNRSLFIQWRMRTPFRINKLWCLNNSFLAIFQTRLPNDYL